MRVTGAPGQTACTGAGAATCLNQQLAGRLQGRRTRRRRSIAVHHGWRPLRTPACRQRDRCQEEDCWEAGHFTHSALCQLHTLCSGK